MFNLNLMPDYQKQSIKRERVFLIAHNAIGIILIVVTIASILLVVSRFILSKNFAQLQQNTALVNVTGLGLQKNITALNEKIAITEIAQKDFTKWTALLTDFTDIIPAGIFINSLFVNGQTGAWRLTGIAQNRNQLIILKESLKSFPHTQSLEAPLSNLLTKQNINFRFGGILAKDIYKSP